MTTVVSFPEGQPAILCPVCNLFHEFHWGPGLNSLGQRWNWNQNLKKPTFDPAQITKVGNPQTGEVHVCHAWVHDGKISFLDETTHKAKGQTMDLQPQ